MVDDAQDSSYSYESKRLHRNSAVMKKSLIRILVVTLVAAAAPAFAGEPRRLSRKVLEDKIRGGWAAQMIGVSYGAPTEFKSNGKIIEGKLPWSPDRVSNALIQDDLYVDMTFAAVMDKLGLDATTEQYGEAFKTSKYTLWHANAGARRLLSRGIKAPMSGHPKYNIHANDIDFQIEADFIGLMTPGLPQESNKYSDRVGHVMNYGDGVYGGMLITGMYAAAFFETDIAKIVEQGLATIPAKSGYAQLVRDVVAAWKRYPTDWRKAWTEVTNTWDKNEACTEGALLPFNIDARLNGGYVVMGLLYGAGDFAKTLEITTRLGQDSDCNPSSAAGVLGVVLGYENIPKTYKAGIAAIAEKKFDFTDYSFNEITQSTVTRALKVIQSVGGKVSETEVVVPQQAPKAPALEQWDMGVPLARLDMSDAAWKYKGKWKTEQYWDTNGLLEKKTFSAGAGAEATLTFDGTAIALVGRCGQDGGRADVYLDGKKVGVADAYSPERTNDDALWHTYDLKPGKHIVRVVTATDVDSRSKGKFFELRSALTFGPHR
jgi:hypothetical protein